MRKGCPRSKVTIAIQEEVSMRVHTDVRMDRKKVKGGGDGAKGMTEERRFSFNEFRMGEKRV